MLGEPQCRDVDVQDFEGEIRERKGNCALEKPRNERRSHGWAKLHSWYQVEGVLRSKDTLEPIYMGKQIRASGKRDQELQTAHAISLIVRGL